MSGNAPDGGVKSQFVKRALIRLRSKPRPLPAGMAAYFAVCVTIALLTDKFPLLGKAEFRWISRATDPHDFWSHIRFSLSIVTVGLILAFYDVPTLQVWWGRLIHRGSQAVVPTWVGIIVVILVGLTVAWGLSALLEAY